MRASCLSPSDIRLARLQCTAFAVRVHCLARLQCTRQCTVHRAVAARGAPRPPRRRRVAPCLFLVAPLGARGRRITASPAEPGLTRTPPAAMPPPGQGLHARTSILSRPRAAFLSAPSASSRPLSEIPPGERRALAILEASDSERGRGTRIPPAAAAPLVLQRAACRLDRRPVGADLPPIADRPIADAAYCRSAIRVYNQTDSDRLF